MLEQLIIWDQQLLLWLNQFHSETSDLFWWIVTSKTAWFPFYALLIGTVIWKHKWNSVWLLLGIALTITLADQFASGFCKPFFERFRPSQEPALEGLVHLYQYADGGFYRGGKFGFISSHAANSFAMATYFFLFWERTFRWAKWLFVWAALVSYSRIALGVHYPGDILAGALSGIVWATLCARLVQLAIARWGEAPFLSLFKNKP